MSVSIILPVYRRAAWIPQCQRMIDHQKHQPDQVLVIEEAESRSQNVAIAGAEYLELDNWTRPQDKFALGGAAAKGDIIITWSTDDYFGPHYITNCLRYLSDCELVSLQSAFVYNIVDRRYGLQQGIRGGHHAYQRSLLGKVEDMREKRIPGIHGDESIDSKRISNDYMTIRHAPAGELRDGWRRCVANPLEGGHMGKHEYTDHNDYNWAWLDARLPDVTIRQWYKDQAAHILDTCPMRPA